MDCTGAANGSEAAGRSTTTCASVGAYSWKPMSCRFWLKVLPHTPWTLTSASIRLVGRRWSVNPGTITVRRSPPVINSSTSCCASVRVMPRTTPRTDTHWLSSAPVIRC